MNFRAATGKICHFCSWNVSCFARGRSMAVYSEIDRKFASASQSTSPWAALCLLFIFLVVGAFGAAGQSFTFQQVAALTNAPPPPANPAGGLVQSTSGYFYGTSFAGGQYGLGTIFQTASSGYVSVVASFNGTNGANPRGTMVSDSAGNLYGVTYGGGVSNAGTVFKMSATGNVTVLHDFYADPGKNPYVGLLMGADSNLYGTTESYGMVFKITRSGVFSNLTTYFGLNGQTLDSVLAQGSDGNLYGLSGSKNFSGLQYGSTFVMPTSGGGPTSGYFVNGGTNGDTPFGGLVPWGSGISFAGVTATGGANNTGGIFFVTNSGTVYTANFSFTGSNGAYPFAPLLVIGTNIYGGTAAGGADGQGVVFEYNVNKGTVTTTSLAGTNGSGVYGGLFRGGFDSYIYGTTRFGGTYGRGTVFRMDTNANNLTSLTSFPTNPPPDAGIIQAPNGNFYGVTWTTGLYGGPFVFQLTPGGTITTFGYLPGITADSSLLATPDGALYGTTFDGGNYNQGSVSRLAQNSTTIIFSFQGTSGVNPFAGLIEGTDGFLYGTTVNGGVGNSGAGYGTVFAMTTNGSLQMSADFRGTNGANPYAPLVQGEDGSFYGTTSAGGTNNLGTVFQVTSSGQLTSLYSFSGPDGANPYGGLVQGPDGFLYGTTANGGLTNGTNATGFGTVFQISTNGALNTLAYFNGTNGANPRGSLVLGPDGNYYGTTLAGGAANDGTVFSVSPGGVLTTVYSFSGTDGASPYAGLFFGSDGALYGTTTAGGPAGGGNIFRIAQPAMLQLSLVGGQIQLAWPVFDSEFQLQSSSDLTDPNGWTPVMDTLSTNGNQVTVLQTAPANNVFYRLVNP
jgi:uncharacterized repeat protein (TIGR03803 family)